MVKPKQEKKESRAEESSFEASVEGQPPEYHLIPSFHERALATAEAAEEGYYASITGNPVLIKPTGTGQGGLRIRRTKKKNPKSAPSWCPAVSPIKILLRKIIDEAEAGMIKAESDPDITALRELGLKYWRHGRREIVPAKP